MSKSQMKKIKSHSKLSKLCVVKRTLYLVCVIAFLEILCKETRFELWLLLGKKQEVPVTFTFHPVLAKEKKGLKSSKQERISYPTPQHILTANCTFAIMNRENVKTKIILTVISWERVKSANILHSPISLSQLTVLAYTTINRFKNFICIKRKFWIS